MAPRLVFISDHNSNGQRLARVLAARGVQIDAVLVQTGSPTRGKGPKVWARSLLDAARSYGRFLKRQKAFYAPLQTRVLPAGAMNSRRMIALLKSLQPDYLIVGSGKILAAETIETARCGVLNVHPGLLPWIRGSGVVGHALLQNVPIGPTLHFIDAGIDTGAVIERRLLPICNDGATLVQLQEEAGELAAQMMGECVETIVQSGQKPPATPQTTRFSLFKWPDVEVRRAQAELVKSGRPRELFEKWQGLTSGAPDWILPPEMMEIPRDL
ncbi:MAG TPA: formyltransferase family protein [Abditibacterium sp.]|jgi:methionyl-tRNA formyltransferase